MSPRYVTGPAEPFEAGENVRVMLEDRCPVCGYDRNTAEGWCRCIDSSSRGPAMPSAAELEQNGPAGPAGWLPTRVHLEALAHWEHEYEHATDRARREHCADRVTYWRGVCSGALEADRFPRILNGRAVWACCVSSIGPACRHLEGLEGVR